MGRIHHKIWNCLFLLFLLLCSARVEGQQQGTTTFEQELDAVADTGKNVVKVLHDRYLALPPKGKFIAGAAVGFLGSRLVISSAVGAIKIAAVAFIAYVPRLLLLSRPLPTPFFRFSLSGFP